MKYGHINHPVPSIAEDLAAIKDLVSKGELTEAEGNKKTDKLVRDRLIHIVYTNGGHMPSQKRMRSFQKKFMQQLKDSKEREAASSKIRHTEEIVQETLS